MEDKSGWRILERCLKDSDDLAWTQFVQRFEPAFRWGIHRAFRSLGFEGDRQDLAADLLQDCYCKVLARERRVLGTLRERDGRALDAFFTKLAERCTRDRLRALWSKKRGSRRELVDLHSVAEHALAATSPSPEEQALMKEARSRILASCRRAAGARQPERNTRVLAMAFLEGLSSREIAKRFAGRLSRTCIDSVIYRARRRLREQGLALGQRRAIA